MILLTGATGFLGRNLVPSLLEAGYHIRALVRPTSQTDFLQAYGVELAYADDISDKTAVAAACVGCDEVIHAAGQFRFWGNESSFWQVNVEGTTAVLEAAHQAQVKKVIHISTIAVIGETPKTGIITEETRCKPLEAYQATKLQGEQRALDYHRQHGLPVVILRPGAFYGPWGRYAFNRLFFEEPLRGWRIKVNGGRHVSFPVFVPDVVQGILLALDKGQAGEIYNICSQSLDHNSINAIISDLAHIGHWRLNIPVQAVLLLAHAWTFLSRYTKREPFYPSNLAHYVFQDWHVSTEKAECELNFKPTPFRHGAKQTIDWYRQQELVKTK